MSSNQGRDLAWWGRDVSWDDMYEATAALWEEVHNHPSQASCECPAVETVARLYELGYRLTKDDERAGD